MISSTSQIGCEAWRGRLHGQGSWKPVEGDLTPNLNITLDSPVNVTYIATQGSPTEDCWTTTFRIYYSMQGGSLKQYPEVRIIVTGRAFVTWLSILDSYLKSFVNVTDFLKNVINITIGATFKSAANQFTYHRGTKLINLYIPVWHNVWRHASAVQHALSWSRLVLVIHGHLSQWLSWLHVLEALNQSKNNATQVLINH